MFYPYQFLYPVFFWFPGIHQDAKFPEKHKGWEIKIDNDHLVGDSWGNTSPTYTRQV